jgi:hypothetical protein
METWIFAGRKLDPEDAEGDLYFQDLESYIGKESATPLPLVKTHTSN